MPINKYLRYLLIAAPHLFWFMLFYILTNNVLVALGITIVFAIMEHLTKKALSKVKINDE